jgi:ABC-type transporter Mla subunit MlaD
MSLTTETLSKPNAPESDEARAWSDVGSALLGASMLDADAIHSAADELERASNYLIDLDLDSSLVDDIVSKLSDAASYIDDAATAINGLLRREREDWPAAASVEAAVAELDSAIVAKLEAALTENADLKARLAAFTQSDIGN